MRPLPFAEGMDREEVEDVTADQEERVMLSGLPGLQEPPVQLLHRLGRLRRGQRS